MLWYCSTITVDCHLSCASCTDNSVSGCITCADGLLFMEGECVKECSEGFFAQDDKCLRCSSPCVNCLSEGKCTSCIANHYLNEHMCVSECPSGTYMDEEAYMCRSCSTECLTCYGPTSNKCLECNSKKGFVKSDGSSECKLLTCNEGSYMDISNSLNIPLCLPCNEMCQNCIDENTCIQCKEGLKEFYLENDDDFVCISCEQYDRGFYMGADGNCKEVCGDGKYMEMVECDDGNRKNGDGCSSDCKIEPEFECKVIGGLSKCTKTIPLTAKLSLRGINKLIVTFSDISSSKINTDELALYMNVALEGISSDCSFSWELITMLQAGQEFYTLEIQTYPECSFEGKNLIYEVTFTDPELITDYWDNPLSTPYLQTKAKRYIHLSAAEQEALSTMGNSFNYASVFSFLLAFALSMFQSAVIGSFWIFISMIQMMFYLPILDCVVPYRLCEFLKNYLSIKTVGFPFDIFPDLPWNPLDYFDEFITDPFNELFSDSGLESVSFIYNHCEEIINWIILFATYVAFRILIKIFPKSK